MTGQRAAETLYESEAMLRLVERELDELSGEDPLPGSAVWGDNPQPHLGGRPMLELSIPGGSLQQSLRQANREMSQLLQGLAASLDPVVRAG